MPSRFLAFSLAFAAIPSAAWADDFCADRPGLGTPPCTAAPGHPVIEIGLAQWDHSADPDAIEDDLTFADLLLRAGIDDRTEVQFGLAGYGSDRSRLRATGAVGHVRGLGDVTLGVRHSLLGAGGPFAAQVFVTLPTGADGIGAGDWGGGILVPTSFNLPAGFALALTPEVDAAVNSSGRGRHLAWGGVAGISHPLAPRITANAELAAWRDNDPAGSSTDARLALSVAVMATPDLQFDVEGDAGLTAAALRTSLKVGLARRF